tara:strand:- start:456 stop:1103 length:648 start_codon:yes stop_codon:yes gene_type:complete
MISSNFNCEELFKEAYNSRYTWPNKFNGYSGKCIFEENERSIDGEFVLDSNFKPEIINISDDDIVKMISSQLFEVAIHRVKREFDEVHKNNNFKFLRETEKGMEIQVVGKNEGDKYIVRDKKINMVFRKIHGVIIEIFVEDFKDTGDGFLSKRYTSQQLDIETLTPKSKRFEYEDNFVNLGIDNIWVLESRIIKFLDDNNKFKNKKFMFKELKAI